MESQVMNMNCSAFTCIICEMTQNEFSSQKAGEITGWALWISFSIVRKCLICLPLGNRSLMQYLPAEWRRHFNAFQSSSLGTRWWTEEPYICEHPGFNALSAARRLVFQPTKHVPWNKRKSKAQNYSPCLLSSSCIQQRVWRARQSACLSQRGNYPFSCHRAPNDL